MFIVSKYRHDFTIFFKASHCRRIILWLRYYKIDNPLSKMMAENKIKIHLYDIHRVIRVPVEIIENDGGKRIKYISMTYIVQKTQHKR